jgi:hypothetical protein
MFVWDRVDIGRADFEDSLEVCVLLGKSIWQYSNHWQEWSNGNQRTIKTPAWLSLWFCLAWLTSRWRSPVASCLLDDAVSTRNNFNHHTAARVSERKLDKLNPHAIESTTIVIDTNTLNCSVISAGNLKSREPDRHWSMNYEWWLTKSPQCAPSVYSSL